MKIYPILVQIKGIKAVRFHFYQKYDQWGIICK